MSNRSTPANAARPKGLGRRMGTELGIYLAAAAGWHFLFAARGANSGFFSSGFAALSSWGSVCAIRGLLCRENETALARATMGRPPRDGGWTAAIGTIHPLAPPALVAPFSGQEAVAYQYRITRFENRTAGPEAARRASRNRHLITAYAGWAMVPSEIRTAGGSIRIGEMPVLLAEGATLADPAAYARAESYLAHTEFADAFGRDRPVPPPGQPPPGTASAGVKVDVRENPGSDLAGWALDETVVRPGETVCAYGLYSAAEKRLRAPAQATGGRLFSLVPGGAAAAKVRLQAQRAFLQIVLALLLAIQLVWAWLA